MLNLLKHWFICSWRGHRWITHQSPIWDPKNNKLIAYFKYKECIRCEKRQDIEII